ncbi:hypothetical protein C5167_037881 [Papaver somniferum]|uniref:Uncharacterized protein n=1 Tax=Papaver somniferum TaxID=3469 RepID=A0A4Y7I7Z4_PAPSO|nr:hypothetical protein C5167_037881 [Papaver somniferum]
MDDTSVVLRCRLGEPYEWFDPYQMVNVEAEVPGLGITHMQPYVPTLVRIPEPSSASYGQIYCGYPWFELHTEIGMFELHTEIDFLHPVPRSFILVFDVPPHNLVGSFVSLTSFWFK